MKSLALATGLLICASIGRAETLTAAQAKAHEGESATVCGTIAGEHTASHSRGEPTFIDLGSAYPNQVFTVLVWGEDRAAVGAFPRTGEHVCATGTIGDYRGIPEIVVRSNRQLSK